MKKCDASQGVRLQDYRQQLVTGKVSSLVLQHPLFLAMTVDLVAEEGDVVLMNRVDLYRRWIQQKLMRDFRSDRIIPVGWENISLLIQAVIGLMLDAALSMTYQTESGIDLDDAIPECKLRFLASNRFGVEVESELYATTSLLEPVGERDCRDMHFRFFHRSFQEYFLAQAICRDKLNVLGYPETVQGLVHELLCV